MTDPATIIATARMGWRLLAKMPWLMRVLLRRAFPISKCKKLLVVDVPGNRARFELSRARPSAALSGVEVTLHNHLPFDLEFEVWRLTMNIDSSAVLDAVLNTRHTVPTTGGAQILIPEISLSDRQVRWVDTQRDDSIRIQVGLHWRCTSAFHSWQDQQTFESLVYVNSDCTEGAR